MKKVGYLVIGLMFLALFDLGCSSGTKAEAPDKAQATKDAGKAVIRSFNGLDNQQLKAVVDKLSDNEVKAAIEYVIRIVKEEKLNDIIFYYCKGWQMVHPASKMPLEYKIKNVNIIPELESASHSNRDWGPIISKISRNEKEEIALRMNDVLFASTADKKVYLYTTFEKK